MMAVKARFNHWLPRWLRVSAITIYPFILFADDIGVAGSDGTIAHEWVHVGQIRALGWFRFYASYLLFYLRGRARGLSHSAAYFEVPYERDAYQRQAEYLDKHKRLS